MVHQIISQIQLHWLQDAVDLYFGINVLAVGCRVMGWSRLADELSKIENAIKAMVDVIMNRGQVKSIILFAFLFLGAGQAHAQNANILALNQSALNKFVLSPGIAYSKHDHNLVNTETVKLWEYSQGNKYISMLDPSIDVGFGTPNRFVLGGSISLIKLADHGITMPILKNIEIRPMILYSASFIDFQDLADAQQDWLFGFSIMSVKF